MWKEVTKENRPPEDQLLIWAFYTETKSGDWQLNFYMLGSYIRKDNRVYSTGGEGFAMKSRLPEWRRIFWQEFEPAPEIYGKRRQ